MESHEIQEESDGIVEVRFTTIHSMRVKMFSDAVWSIIATIMIVPTMHHSEEFLHSTKDITHLLKEVLPQLVLYFLAFLIICTTWTCHVWTFQTMKKVTDLSILFNLVVLLAGSFLPYFYSLMSRFRTWPTIIIYGSIQIAIGLIQILIVLHSFSYPGVLTAKIEEKSDKQKMGIKCKIIGQLMVGPVFCLLAICLSFASTTAAIACIGMILVYPWIQSVFVVVMSRIPGCGNVIGKKKRRLERDVLLTQRIKKERIEAFSDGVFAITSTLLVLDITEKYLPSKEKVKTLYGGQVAGALTAQWGVYVSYVLAFMIIGLFWYTHLSLFKNLEKFSRLMLFANSLALSCVGMIPFSFSLVLRFKNIPTVILGLQFGSAALFLISVFYTLLYVFGIIFQRCNKNEKWISPDVQPGGKDFALMIFQLAWAPIGSAIVLILSFMTKGLIAAYVGSALVVLYAILLCLWKTIKANFFGEENGPIEKGEYSRMRLTDEIDEAHIEGDE